MTHHRNFHYLADDLILVPVARDLSNESAHPVLFLKVLA